MRVVLEIEIMTRIWRTAVRVDKSVTLRKGLIQDGGFLHMVIFCALFLFLLSMEWGHLHPSTVSMSFSVYPVLF
jgi:hypothetical protein